ncbi:MAG: hypothetical protein AB1489_40265 [Acidobacteriota bacterium]
MTHCQRTFFYLLSFFASSGKNGFDALRNAKFQFSPLRRSNGEPAPEVAAFTRTSENLIVINTRGTFSTLDDPKVTIGDKEVNVDCGTGFRGDKLGALLLLHELGHLVGLFGDDAGDEKKTNKYTAGILKNCFDCGECK